MQTNLFAYLYNLQKVIGNQRKDRQIIDNLQLTRLKRVLSHAYDHINYYRKLFKNSQIHPDDIKNIQDLVKIPITSRADFQRLPIEDIVAKGTVIEKCFNLRTSGSTGRPLDIFINNNESAVDWLFHRMLYFESGGKLKDKELMITVPRNFAPNQWFHRLGILRVKCTSIYNDLNDQWDVISQYKPDIILGYASNLHSLAVEVGKYSKKIITPRIILSTAELLSKKKRECINSVFKAEIFDYYACNECGIIASECNEHSGYHINTDNVVVEFVKDNGSAANPGEEGDIILTSLNRYTMPFIRYRIADRGILSKSVCFCGKTTPLMEKIMGRIYDNLVLLDGKTVSPYFLTCEIENIPGIIKYQVIQNELLKFTIRISANDKFSMTDNETLVYSFRRILGKDIELKIEMVDHFSNEEGKAKFRVVHSLLSL